MSTWLQVGACANAPSAIASSPPRSNVAKVDELVCMPFSTQVGNVEAHLHVDAGPKGKRRCRTILGRARRRGHST